MEKPVLKFWSHDLNRPLVDKVHTHPYWQMEYIVRGGGTRVFDRPPEERQFAGIQQNISFRISSGKSELE